MIVALLEYPSPEYELPEFVNYFISGVFTRAVKYALLVATTVLSDVDTRDRDVNVAPCTLVAW